MFTDTHCHLSHIQERGEDLASLLAEMTERAFPFVLDIGTKSGDLAARLAKVRDTGAIPPYLHFSCGLWPDGAVIEARHDALKALASDIDQMLDLCAIRFKSDGVPAFAALGECGLDRFWNGPSAAERVSSAEDGPGTADTAGEEELFGLQLDMARKLALPVIVHSRDAFDATLGSIKNGGYDSGVIHCFSYGIAEARAFLDRGWYISFPGNITWAKKDADRERIAALVRYVPRDRLLLETDAPYLAPAPHRGKTNTPLLIEHTYERAAAILGIETAALALLVLENARALFAVKA